MEALAGGSGGLDGATVAFSGGELKLWRIRGDLVARKHKQEADERHRRSGIHHRAHCSAGRGTYSRFTVKS
jgi:hypothetical protein